MSNDIKFVVLGDVKDLEKNLANAQKGFSTMAKVSAAAFAGLTASAYGFMEAARQQELSINTLNQALKNQGKYTEEASEDLIKYAAALQKITLFGDENIIQAESLIASFGFEGEMLKQLTKATLDLAQAKGMDLVAAGDLVSKSVGSTTNALTRYGIAVDGAAGSNERASSAVENINRLFGGQAEAAAQGLGATVQLKMAMGDLAEDIGTRLAPAILDLTSKARGFVQYLQDNPEIAKISADFIILGIKVTAAATAFALLGKAWISIIPIVAALNTQITFLSTVSFLGLNTNVLVLVKNMGLLYPAVAIIGAAWAGWNIGKLISDITGLSDAINRLGAEWGEVKAQQVLGADYVSEAEFNAAREGWMERKKLLDEEKAEREKEQQDKIAKLNETTAFITENAEYLKAISAAQTQEELDDLIEKLELERQAQIDDLLLKQQILEDAGVLEVEKKQEIREQIKAINDKYDDLEVQARKQTNDKISAFEKKAADLAKQINEDKIGSLKSTLQQAAQLNSKFANAYKVVAIGEAVMSTAAGVTRAFKDFPFPTSLVVAGLIAAKGAVEIATIASQSFASGSADIPRDMVANVHKREIIIPATFADAIRSGDLSLSGSSRPGAQNSGGGVVFDFSSATFNGVTESFVRDIFTRASEAINNRTLSPLPAV